MLVERYTEEEIKQAVWDCKSMKSPGPDGVSSGFIKDFWEDLKSDIFRFVMEFHEKGKLVKGINSTFIALIPKKDNPSKLNDFGGLCLQNYFQSACEQTEEGNAQHYLRCPSSILPRLISKKPMFEIISGLKVNFHKSGLIRINVEDSWLKDATSVLNCKVGSLPFSYLGIPIGADPRKIRTWEPAQLFA
ncbi:unnamed protein product [Trifolium pratense]|uniref:Uncharacterized protein n=1 Tax=Trifolium pratense TaxID=57577 RepID=A0ACB0LSL1_TRIPR|nr:unnamed protein product [Trifolium pratense]